MSGGAGVRDAGASAGTGVSGGRTEVLVIVAYRPKPGHADALVALVRTHVPRLAAAGLVTARAPIAMQAADGTVVEVFEWASRAAIARAHDHPAVQAMWAEFAAVCEYVPVATVAEASQLFAELTPI